MPEQIIQEKGLLLRYSKAKAYRLFFVFVMFSLTALLLLKPVKGHAASFFESVTDTIDDTYLFEGHWPQEARDETLYPIVTIHKVINRDGRTYVCAAYISAHSKAHLFFKRSKVYAGKRNLKAALWRLKTPAIGRSYTGTTEIQAITEWFSGRTINCARARARWRPEFSSKPSRFSVPETVWIKEQKRW
ncbi:MULTISPECIES: hypothetical protein [unclassified Leisingera]|uniref:hypothetical protein n=1 Tax=unclassified Leisingera TaxID=2614906 RepID=UPI001269AB15|nr:MULTISPECIES: hypothetical protein [unclassified Leisingera]